MSQTMVKVYYIGTKPQKVDNVSSAKNRAMRIWRGFGTALMIPEQEAAELTRFETVWGDEERFQAVAAEREKVERARFDADVERLQRLRARRTTAPITQHHDDEGFDDGGNGEGDGEGDEGGDGAGGNTHGDSQSSQTQEQGDQTQDRDKLIQAAVLSLNPDSLEDYTAQKTPRVARVTEIVGTNVAAEEIDDAVKRLRAEGKLK